MKVTVELEEVLKLLEAQRNFNTAFNEFSTYVEKLAETEHDGR